MYKKKKQELILPEQKMEMMLDILNEQQELNIEFREAVEDHAERIDYLENDVEITTQQQNEITSQVKRTVAVLLDREEYAKHSRKFFADMYRHLRQYGSSRPISRTPKRNYESVLRGIREYNPNKELIIAEHKKELAWREEQRLETLRSLN